MSEQRGGKMGPWGVEGKEGDTPGKGRLKEREEGQGEKAEEPKLATLPQMPESHVVIGRL